jgi:hypothetical protein
MRDTGRNFVYATNTVVTSPTLVRRFIETTPAFRSEKFTLAEVFKAVEYAEQRARSHLAGVVWHDLSKVAAMYRDTLGIMFPPEMGPLHRAVLERHDMVHRQE